MHYEIGSLVVAGVVLLGAIASIVKYIVRSELALVLDLLDHRYELRKTAKTRFEEVERRIGALERT